MFPRKKTLYASDCLIKVFPLGQISLSNQEQRAKVSQRKKNADGLLGKNVSFKESQEESSTTVFMLIDKLYFFGDDPGTNCFGGDCEQGILSSSILKEGKKISVGVGGKETNEGCPKHDATFLNKKQKGKGGQGARKEGDRPVPVISEPSVLTPVRESHLIAIVTTLPPPSVSTTPCVPQQTKALIPIPTITTDAPTITTAVSESDALSTV
ncbi:hypothetical protein Tco_0426309, partial [Tanacetum coccineum]